MREELERLEAEGLVLRELRVDEAGDVALFTLTDPGRRLLDELPPASLTLWLRHGDGSWEGGVAELHSPTASAPTGERAEELARALGRAYLEHLLESGKRIPVVVQRASTLYREQPDALFSPEDLVSKAADDNDLLRAGVLPDDPAEGAGPAPEPAPEPVPEEAPDERRARERREAEEKAEALLDAEAERHLHPATAVLASFPERWETSPPPRSTGIQQLDRILSGGLRSGDFLLACAQAKAGKSALVGGIAFDFARPTAGGRTGLTIYAPCEMSKEEIVARWNHA